MKRIFLCCSLAIINCYASTVIHRSKFAQARASIPPPVLEILEPPMPTGFGDEDLIPPGIDGGYNGEIPDLI